MIDREWFGSLRSFLQNMGLNEEAIRQFILNAYEIDEDCETLATMINDDLKTALTNSDSELFVQTLINYHIRLEHVADHIKVIKSPLQKMIAYIERVIDEA